MEFRGLNELIAHTVKVAALCDEAVHEGLEGVTSKLLSDTRATFGHYQEGAGPFGAWPELAERTKADRVALGFSENDPLMRSGELRDSYYKLVQGMEGGVGSDLGKALGMEIGDPIKNIPARSTIGLTFARTEKRLFEEMGLPVDALLIQGAVRKMFSSINRR